MSQTIRTARKIHRWVSYIVFAQVTLWILGGLTFAVLPFDSVVKGGAVMEPVENPAFPEGWLATLAPHVSKLDKINGVNAHNSSQGLLVELLEGDESHWIRLGDGLPATAPSAGEIESYAQTLYRGEGAVSDTRHIAEPEYRYLGLVDELYGRTDVWRVSFDDAYDTRLYFDAPTGRYLTIRNDFWVFYDAMWRLHIMDYGSGEDFNNVWLRIFTPLAMIFALSGLVLTWNAARRGWRQS